MQPAWPPGVWYVDPEAIDGGIAAPDSQGIITAQHDIETAPTIFCCAKLSTGEVVEQIPADEMLHIKIGVDSNVERGVSILLRCCTRLVRSTNGSTPNSRPANCRPRLSSGEKCRARRHSWRNSRRALSPGQMHWGCAGNVIGPVES